MHRIERNFWPPSVTSQFCVCPIPFHMDTYRGCQYGCLFCFARDMTRFARRNGEGQERRQAYITGNSPEGLARWCSQVVKKRYDYSDAAMVAFKERIPVKIGATADPFPMCELSELITYECLKVFRKYDYPVQISTKNPKVFLKYAHEFRNSNIALNVSCSFCDDDIARQIETGAIDATKRFEAIQELSKMGYKVTVRIQPFILPYALQSADRFIKTLAEIGAYGFETEGLKLRVTSSAGERAIYQRIGDVFGFDIIEDFKAHGMIEGGDRVYNIETKRKMLQTYTDLANKYGIKFFNADNYIDPHFGCGAECCGTDFLRNHKVWGGARRSLAFPKDLTPSEHFGKCLVNFTRNSKNSHRTIADVCREYNINEDKKLGQTISMK